MICLLLCLLFPVALSHTPYGSKTPYRLVGGDVRDFTFPCRPVSLYSLHRHGSRNIGDKNVKKIDALLKALRTQYTSNGVPSSDLSWILDFKHGHKPNKELVEEGYEELAGQGERFLQAFPHLFAAPSSPAYNVQVGTSSKGRCVSSALSFLHGVYQTDYRILNESRVLTKTDIRQDCGEMCHVYKPITTPHSLSPAVSFDPSQDALLRYYSACKRYKDKAKEKAVWQADAEQYLTSKVMEELVVIVGKRLGVILSPRDVITLHVLCSYEILLPRLMPNSQFCALFKDQELYITAYYLDLLRYAGKMMSEAVDSSCILFQDGIRFLKKRRGVSLKFAHTETIFPLLEHIGYLSEPMRGGEMSLLNRQFFGDITPLASNFLLVAMQCPESNDTLVQAFLNEHPIEFPNCGSPCKLDQIVELFPPSGCDFVSICQDPSYINQLVAGSIALVVIGELVRRRFIL